MSSLPCATKNPEFYGAVTSSTHSFGILVPMKSNRLDQSEFTQSQMSSAACAPQSDSRAAGGETQGPRSGTFRTAIHPECCRDNVRTKTTNPRPPANVRFDRALSWSLSRGLARPDAASMKHMLDAEGRGRL